jgi:acyl carrier protein phosphodiesterase
VNWLAHLRLAPCEPLVRIGNLAGDFVRGVDIQSLHPCVQRGIEQHRALDKYVDAHSVFLRSRSRFTDPNRRYAGVALDVFYDHFLARDWAVYGDGRDLTVFVDEVHEQMHEHRSSLPDDLRALHDRMAEDQWLTMYGTLEGIDRVFRAMSRRQKRASPLSAMTAELRRNYEAIEKDFAELWPDLLAFSRAFRNPS